MPKQRETYEIMEDILEVLHTLEMTNPTKPEIIISEFLFSKKLNSNTVKRYIIIWNKFLEFFQNESRRIELNDNVVKFGERK